MVKTIFSTAMLTMFLVGGLPILPETTRIRLRSRVCTEVHRTQLNKNLCISIATVFPYYVFFDSSCFLHCFDSIIEHEWKALCMGLTTHVFHTHICRSLPSGVYARCRRRLYLSPLAAFCSSIRNEQNAKSGGFWMSFPPCYVRITSVELLRLATG
jgi:hypothetical protein